MQFWDVPHQRGAGFTLQVLHAGCAYRTMVHLAAHPGTNTADIARDLTPDHPDAHAASHCLSMLRKTGLAKRADTLSEAGTHSTHRLTEFGTGLVAAVEPLGAWSMARFAITDRVEATEAAALLFSRRWSFTLMAAIANAGAKGIEPGRAEAAVNTLMNTQAEQVAYRLYPNPRHAALNDLRANGLIVRRKAPTLRSPARVLYSASATGEALLEALWPVGEWGIRWDRELSAFVGTVTKWWGAPER